MHYADAVGSLESGDELIENGPGLCQAHRAFAPQPGSQSLPLEKFHGEEGEAIVLHQIEDAAHVSVSDLAGEQDLLAEAGQRRRNRRQS